MRSPAAKALVFSFFYGSLAFAAESNSSAVAVSLPAAAAALVPSDTFFDSRNHPLQPRQKDLLLRANYQLHSDGSLWNAGATRQLRQSELAFVLHRAESAQRLRALVQLKILLSSSAGERYLTPAEREQVRRIVRENWPYFTLGTRKDFKHYFSVQELEGMNRDPAPTDHGVPVALTDQEPETIEEWRPGGRPVPRPYLPPLVAPPNTAPAAQPPAVQAPAVVAVAVPQPVVAVAVPPQAVVPVPAAPPLARAPVAMPTATAMNHGSAQSHTTASSAGQTVTPGPAVSTPAPGPTPVPIVAMGAAVPSVGTGADREIGGAPVALAVVPNAMLPPVVVPPPAAPLPALKLQEPAAAAPAPLRAIGAAEFEKFLIDAPYGRDAKALLRVIAEKANEPARSRALETVMAFYPQLVYDSIRAGAASHAALLVQRDAHGDRGYTIALSPGPAIQTRKKLFFGEKTRLLPDAPAFYSELRVPFPIANALRHDSVAGRTAPGEWGQTRVYEDGTLRGAYTHFQQAGSLLRELLRLDAARRGWDASPYAVELYGRSAQWQLTLRLETELRDDRFLDPTLRSDYRAWRDDPDEYRDHLAHALAASRRAGYDPRRGGPAKQAERGRAAAPGCPLTMRDELQADAQTAARGRLAALLDLEASGLVEAEPLEQARRALGAAPSILFPSQQDCVARLQAELGGLRLAASLLEEMEQSEKAVRAGRIPNARR